LREGNESIKAEGSLLELFSNAIKASTDFAISNVVEVESVHKSFPYRCDGRVAELSRTGQREFALGNLGDSAQALDSSVFRASINRFPTSTDDTEGFFDNALSVRDKSVLIALTVMNKLDFERCWSCRGLWGE